MRYLDFADGYLAYRTVMGMDISLGPPICAERNRTNCIHQFLAHTRKPVMTYLPGNILPDLTDTKLYVSSMGIDHYVDMDALLRSPSKAVQGALKKSDKAKFDIQALDFDLCTPEQLAKLKMISTVYLRNAQCTSELSFINRPMQFHNDGMKRTFVLRKFDGETAGVFGYAVLNPYYTDGGVSGYLLDIIRFEPTRLWGVWLSTVWHFARMLAAQGYGLALGFCPLYGLQSSATRSSRWLNWQTHCASRLLRNSRYVRRLYELKSEIPGWQEPRYFASYSRNLGMILLGFINASGLTTRQLFGPELARSMVAGITTQRTMP